MIRVESAHPSSFLAPALRLASRFLGVELVAVEAGAAGGAPPDVYHGSDASRPCRLRIPEVERYTAEDVPVPPAPEASVHPGGEPFPFDLFAALRFWLADEGNAGAPAEAFDEHDRLIAEHSVQERLRVRDVPVVNAYLLLFGAWLRARLGVEGRSPLPPGKRCAIFLSHDVDEPDDPSLRSDLGRIALATRKRELRTSVALARGSLARLRRGSGRHWLFSEVLEAESRLGLASTFFFASKSAWAPDASVLDVAYDLHAPRFRRVFDEIAGRGGEVGLHVSYRARESAERIEAERRALEGASGVRVRGCRHHYWHMRRPFFATLADHARAGLAYDASTAFNEVPGLRLATAFPFHPWDPATGASIEALQIPTVVMDAALFREGAAGVDEAVERFSGILEKLKRYRGAAAIDWHVRTSWPGSPQYRVWGETYLAILALVAADDEVEVGPCASALAQPDA